MQKYEVQQKTVGDLIGWINGGEIAIPEIQRPFVWTQTKVRDLMDSLYKGYPVGYIITWRNPDVKSKDGELSKGRKIIIDGQQRITAVMAAIAGQVVVGKKYQEQRIRIAFNPVTENFATRTAAIANDKEWFGDIAEILGEGVSTYSVIRDYLERNPGVDDRQVEKAVGQLVAIKNRPIGVIELTSNLDIETVTEIFIRINSKGTTLGQADFALSKIASYGEFGTNLRKLIDYFSHLAEDPSFYKTIVKNDSAFAKGDHFRKIAWLKNENDTLYRPSYSDLTRVSFMKEFQRGRFSDLVKILSGRNFETRTYETELQQENFERLEKSLLDVVNQHNFTQFLMIVRSTGFIRGDMIRSRGVLNFAYTLFLIMKENKSPHHELQKVVARWFVASILTSRYSSSSETQMEVDLRAIKEKGPVRALEDIEKAKLSDVFWEVEIVSELTTDSVKNSALNCFWAAQIRANDKAFISHSKPVRDLVEVRGDKHHLFPAAYLEESGIPENQRNQVANFVFAETPDNIKIANKAPKVYFQQLLEQMRGGEMAYGAITSEEELQDNLRVNAIPAGIVEMEADDYLEFLAQRRELMAKKLKDYYFSL